MVTLKKRLSSLKLSGIVKTIDTRNEFALKNSISYIEFLELLIEDEFNNRAANSYRKRLNNSKIIHHKTLKDYDFTYAPEIDQKMIYTLAASRYINENKNIIFMGKPGTGKTHLSIALGLEALKQGYKVLFVHVGDMVNSMYRARGDGTYNALIKKYMNTDLLIIDELGFKKIPHTHIEDFFEVIRKKYETGSIIITTNRSFEEWADIFGDAVLASAIVDRLVHHSYIFRFTGNSYRLKEVKDNIKNIAKNSV